MKKENIQKILTMVSFVMPTILLGIMIFSTFFLANKVAMNFDARNNVTRYGDQNELLILGLVFYLLPMIISVICVNIKAFWSKIIGIIASICVSVVFFGVLINILVLTFRNSGSSTSTGGLWVSFALTIIGFASIITSHILPLIKNNLIFKKQNQFILKSSEFNKINVILAAVLFIFGFIVCFCCAMLKNYYSFIALFAAVTIACGFGYLHFKRFADKNFVKQEKQDV